MPVRKCDSWMKHLSYSFSIYTAHSKDVELFFVLAHCEVLPVGPRQQVCGCGSIAAAPGPTAFESTFVPVRNLL